MNRILFTALAFSVALSASASLATNHPDSTRICVNESVVRSIQPTYLEDVVKAGGWKSNWFVSVSDGASNFLGSPLGCDDMFGRLKPTFRANVGKWFTPTVGSRLTFEGFDIKASDLTTQGYRAYHMDMMWNVAPCILKTGFDSRWDIIPFFGVGCAHNNKLGHAPFAISYGVIGQYKVTDRLRVTAELSNLTTSKCFDGHSMTKGLGDHILGLTAGVSFTFGENGWKGVVDAAPYMAQNEQLLARNYSLKESNRNFARIHSHDIRVIEELKKILRIEGLLGKYGSRLAELDTIGYDVGRTFPKNDYSGLNSLLARIRDSKNGYKIGGNADNGHDDIDADNGYDDIDGTIDEAFINMTRVNNTDVETMLMDDSLVSEDSILPVDKTDNIIDGNADKIVNDNDRDKLGAGSDKSWNAYIKAVTSGKQCIGAPVYFFFKIGTAKLTDESQLVNISEIARLAVKYNLKVKVVGAADSATGSDAINRQLSGDRAKRIADELKNCGVPASRISARGNGGIDAYEPTEANRHTRIELCR